MTRALPCLVFLLALACCTGCGKKIWPQPQATEDSFQWGKAKVKRDKGCLFVEAMLSGAAHNLASVVVEIELMNDDCQGCPFSMDLGRTVYPGDPGFRQAGSEIQLYLCGLDPKQPYRFRLVGRNAYRALPTAVSDIYTALP